MEFNEMNLSSKTRSALESMKYTTATEVQEKSIPLILSGREVVVRSQTGTGKTAAFGIGIIELIIQDPGKKALVLAPTRELAIQIRQELFLLAKNHGLRIFVVYGGEGIERQIHALSRGYDIVVATPGRLLDHSRRGTIDLSVFNLIVLDEADRMLDMGFKEDLDAILDNVSLDRQIYLFSATIDEPIKRIAHTFMKEPVFLEVGPQEKAPTIDELFIKLDRGAKFDKLKSILTDEHFSRVIVFVATQRAAEYIGHKLHVHKVSAQYLHGAMRQNKRERIMHDFKQGKFHVLVTTDVAARGLHIEDISHIINYDQAGSKETHTHRIGRTGRMGKTGKAITFVETGGTYGPARPGGYGGGSRRSGVRPSFGRQERRPYGESHRKEGGGSDHHRVYRNVRYQSRGRRPPRRH